MQESMPAQPDWTGLPAALWVSILDCHRPRYSDDYYYPPSFLQQHTPAWLLHYRTLASASATCRSLHSLLHSPAAACLWEPLCLAPAYPQLPASKLPNLKRYIEAHAHRANTLYVAGGVCVDHLRLAVSRASALSILYTSQVCNPAEVDQLGSAVAASGTAIKWAILHDAPVAAFVPASVTDLDILVSHEHDQLGRFYHHSLQLAGSRWALSPHNLLSRYVHLCHLERLFLGLPDGWSLTAASCTLLSRCFPKLERLTLHMATSPSSDLTPLQALSQCVLEFDLCTHLPASDPATGIEVDHALTGLLQQLLHLPVVSELTITASQLTEVQQQLLRRHSSICSLQLRLAAPYCEQQLQFPPQIVKVNIMNLSQPTGPISP